MNKINVLIQPICSHYIPKIDKSDPCVSTGWKIEINGINIFVDHLIPCFSLKKKQKSMLLFLRMAILHFQADVCLSTVQKIGSHGIRAFLSPSMASFPSSLVDDVEFIKAIFVQARIYVLRLKERGDVDSLINKRVHLTLKHNSPFQNLVFKCILIKSPCFFSYTHYLYSSHLFYFGFLLLFLLLSA